MVATRKTVYPKTLAFATTNTSILGTFFADTTFAEPNRECQLDTDTSIDTNNAFERYIHCSRARKTKSNPAWRAQCEYGKVESRCLVLSYQACSRFSSRKVIPTEQQTNHFQVVQPSRFECSITSFTYCQFLDQHVPNNACNARRR